MSWVSLNRLAAGRLELRYSVLHLLIDQADGVRVDTDVVDDVQVVELFVHVPQRKIVDRDATECEKGTPCAISILEMVALQDADDGLVGLVRRE